MAVLPEEKKSNEGHSDIERVIQDLIPFGPLPITRGGTLMGATNNVTILKFELDHSLNVIAERSYCLVEVYSHNGDTLVTLTEPNDSQGRSVTNAIQDICKRVVQRLAQIPWLEMKSITFVEHYENQPDSWDVVTFEDDNFEKPVWRREVSYADVRQEFENYWNSN